MLCFIHFMTNVELLNVYLFFLVNKFAKKAEIPRAKISLIPDSSNTKATHFTVDFF